MGGLANDDRARRDTRNMSVAFVRWAARQFRVGSSKAAISRSGLASLAFSFERSVINRTPWWGSLSEPSVGEAHRRCRC